MSEPEAHQLTVPDSVANDDDAIEIMRMWWSKSEPVMSIKPAFNDPTQFGRMLAYAARHMAHGYAVRHGHNEKQAYDRILVGITEVIRADNALTVAEPDAPKGGTA